MYTFDLAKLDNIAFYGNKNFKACEILNRRLVLLDHVLANSRQNCKLLKSMVLLLVDDHIKLHVQCLNQFVAFDNQRTMQR